VEDRLLSTDGEAATGAAPAFFSVRMFLFFLFAMGGIFRCTTFFIIRRSAWLQILAYAAIFLLRSSYPPIDPLSHIPHIYFAQKGYGMERGLFLDSLPVLLVRETGSMMYHRIRHAVGFPFIFIICLTDPEFR